MQFENLEIRFRLIKLWIILNQTIDRHKQYLKLLWIR